MTCCCVAEQFECLKCEAHPPVGRHDHQEYCEEHAKPLIDTLLNALFERTNP